MKFIFIIMAILIFVSLGLIFARNFWGEKDLSKAFVVPGPATPLPTPTGLPEAAVSIGSDWKVFKSKDESFRFHYPPTWQVSQKPSVPPVKGAKSTLGMTVQTWVLTNFSYPEAAEEVPLPQGAVKMDFEIFTEGGKESVEDLFDCGAREVSQCQYLTVNGITYRKMVSKNGLGGQDTLLMTIKNDKIYKISGTTVFVQGGSQEKEMEEIIKTFEILESS